MVLRRSRLKEWRLAEGKHKKSVIGAWFSDIVKLRTLHSQSRDLATMMPWVCFIYAFHKSTRKSWIYGSGSIYISAWGLVARFDWRVSSKTSQCEASDSGLHAFSSKPKYCYIRQEGAIDTTANIMAKETLRKPVGGINLSWYIWVKGCTYRWFLVT